MEKQNKRMTIAGNGIFKSLFDNSTKLTSAQLASVSTAISSEFTSRFISPATIKTEPARLSARDMLNISEEISREYAVRRLTPPSTSKIVLLPVDPEHLHAYWHLDNKENNQAPTELTLRVYAQPEHYPTVDDDQPTWFDVGIDQREHHKKINVPETLSNRFYSAAIGHQHQHRFISLAHSETTYIPSSFTQPSTQHTLADAYGHTMTRNPSGQGKNAR
jgi:uncharacterized protein DUF4912